jgi:hypothetical protein
VIYTQCFMMFGISNQIILRFCLSNFKNVNVGVTDGRVFFNYTFVMESCIIDINKQKQTPWPLVRKRNILSDRRLLAKFSANFCGWRGVAWSARWIPHGIDINIDRNVIL